MKDLLILGAGTAGTMMANKLRKELNILEWNITIVDRDTRHYYQPGFLFIPFGIYNPQDVVRDRREFFPEEVNFVLGEIEQIDGHANTVRLKDGKELVYDVLVLATGARTAPEDTEGMKGKLWYKDIFDFYTYEGSVRLAEKLRDWKGGKLVINLAEQENEYEPVTFLHSFLRAK